ncbi:hypothetical protein CR203_18630 [Salipaludibacillus neizhouensis]|uniref:Saccharopine dehydrogenase NADP binding domain-containing protein n=1 Tax=Salipaludibacillus neizhouensis TaxID=885475 RepID=A0A3A9K3K0_9BACI|nr:saccharopine dehydrogenase NADP-binding domain-containing protein [Salipaludibacillus neizhouensis]RKL65868.1 hypothetical protein CR203_18630 [Salipaludibacillus neizhouensis]
MSLDSYVTLSHSGAKILIYGASGYTGKLISARAQQAGLDFEIAGRSEASVSALARSLGVSYRIFAVEDAQALRSALKGVTAILNCAGPFAVTARPIMEACIDSGVHYLDITAEFKVYELAQSLSKKAAAASVMLLPGVGWDVVPSDCLAVYTASKVDKPRRLRIALEVAGAMSRGSATSAGEILSVGLLVRSEGKLVAAPNADTSVFDFGEGNVECARLSFGDLVTAWASTNIPNIEMFVHVKGDAFPEGDLSLLPDGPTPEERDANRAKVVAEVTGEDGSIARARIETVNGYSYTALSSVEAARRVHAGHFLPGFQTPASAFGAEFAASIPDTRIIDLDPIVPSR